MHIPLGTPVWLNLPENLMEMCICMICELPISLIHLCTEQLLASSSFLVPWINVVVSTSLYVRMNETLNWMDINRTINLIAVSFTPECTYRPYFNTVASACAFTPTHRQCSFWPFVPCRLWYKDMLVRLFGDSKLVWMWVWMIICLSVLD